MIGHQGGFSLIWNPEDHKELRNLHLYMNVFCQDLYRRFVSTKCQSQSLLLYVVVFERIKINSPLCLHGRKIRPFRWNSTSVTTILREKQTNLGKLHKILQRNTN
jgi:hypothetical protein